MSLQAFTLGDVVRENARSFPGRNAFVCGGERIGFDRVNERVDAVAVSLSRAGIASGARVLWLAQNCHRAFETMFACAKLGAVFVPANWRQSAEEMTFTIDDARPGVVIWQEAEIGERVAKARAGARDDAVWVGLDGTGAGTWAAFVDQSAPDEPHASVSEDDMVVQMYTAAFEGRPRGALLTHRNLVTSSLQHALTQRLGWEDVHLASMPFFHILGLLNALAIFHVGARNVIVRRSDPEEMSRLISQEGVTRAILIGPTVAGVIKAAEQNGYDISSLRTTPGAGGAGAARWAAMTTPTQPPVGGYGQTELAGQVTYDAYGPPGTGSHGRAAPLVVLRIVDEDGREVGTGEAGEIVVRGPTVSAGYADGGGRALDEWHRTGDLGRREPDGSISFIGARTELIKTGAENVYPAEVEAALRRHSAVEEACVFGVPEPMWRQAVKAVVVRSDAAVTADTLIEFCKQHIASYKKPRIVEFVDALPRLPSGAVDREETKRLYGGAPSKE